MIGPVLDAHDYAKANIAMYKRVSQPSFIYTVQVKQKDYDQAKKITTGS